MRTFQPADSRTTRSSAIRCAPWRDTPPGCDTSSSSLMGRFPPGWTWITPELQLLHIRYNLSPSYTVMNRKHQHYVTVILMSFKHFNIKHNVCVLYSQISKLTSWSLFDTDTQKLCFIICFALNVFFPLISRISSRITATSPLSAPLPLRPTSTASPGSPKSSFISTMTWCSAKTSGRTTSTATRKDRRCECSVQSAHQEFIVGIVWCSLLV